jgi:hypothetical protein
MAGAGLELFGSATGGFRMLPSFLIVGGQRCGTNSIYEYLVQHPCVGRALPEQEVHFFDLKFDRGLRWYRGHFPTRTWERVARTRSGSNPVTGESSPYYMFHPLAGPRIAETLPDVKLLVLLRNPVDRAYSHYHHERARGHETTTFEEAIEREPERLRGEEERIRLDPRYRSFNHQHFSYLSRSRYAEQLEVFFSLFGRERVLVVLSERIFEDPAAVHDEVLGFLGLPRRPLADYGRHNAGRYGALAPQLRRRLDADFAEPNDRLSRLLGTDLPWD